MPPALPIFPIPLLQVAGVAAAAAAELSRTNQVSAAAGLGAVAGGAGAVAIAIPVVKFATGFAKDRLEDAKASSMLPEDVNVSGRPGGRLFRDSRAGHWVMLISCLPLHVQRMHKVRRWRQQLSAEEAQAWADYGFDLRRLDPPAYSQGEWGW